MKKENKKNLQIGQLIDTKTKINVIGGGTPPIKKGDIKQMNK
ncbi:MAG: hypothetical protein AAF039_15420 [Bacteroidota bacterium]